MFYQIQQLLIKNFEEFLKSTYFKDDNLIVEPTQPTLVPTEQATEKPTLTPQKPEINPSDTYTTKIPTLPPPDPIPHVTPSPTSSSDTSKIKELFRDIQVLVEKTQETITPGEYVFIVVCCISVPLICVLFCLEQANFNEKVKREVLSNRFTYDKVPVEENFKKQMNPKSNLNQKNLEITTKISSIYPYSTEVTPNLKISDSDITYENIEPSKTYRQMQEEKEEDAIHTPITNSNHKIQTASANNNNENEKIINTNINLSCKIKNNAEINLKNNNLNLQINSQQPNLIEHEQLLGENLKENENERREKNAKHIEQTQGEVKPTNHTQIEEITNTCLDNCENIYTTRRDLIQSGGLNSPETQSSLTYTQLNSLQNISTMNSNSNNNVNLPQKSILKPNSSYQSAMSDEKRERLMHWR